MLHRSSLLRPKTTQRAISEMIALGSNGSAIRALSSTDPEADGSIF